MKFHLIIEDTPQGVCLNCVSTQNGYQNNPESSLAAMWMTKWYTEMQVAHGKGHAYIQETDNESTATPLSFH